MTGEGAREKHIDILKVREVKNEKQANKNIPPALHTHTHTDTHACTDPEAVDSAVFHSL